MSISVVQQNINSSAPVTDWCEHTWSSAGGRDQITSLTETKAKSKLCKVIFTTTNSLRGWALVGSCWFKSFASNFWKGKVCFFFNWWALVQENELGSSCAGPGNLTQLSCIYSLLLIRGLLWTVPETLWFRLFSDGSTHLKLRLKTKQMQLWTHTLGWK